MKIAVIGWGSLIPDPVELAIDKSQDWFNDGPLLPIEYARISNGKRLTLVLYERSEPIKTLWTIMTLTDLNQAKENLRLREEMKSTRQIGFVDIANSVNDDFSNSQIIESIKEWGISKELDAVIWTGLKANFESKVLELFGETARVLNIENIRWYLSRLSTEQYESAKNYILNTPKSTKTTLRPLIEKILK